MEIGDIVMKLDSFLNFDEIMKIVGFTDNRIILKRLDDFSNFSGSTIKQKYVKPLESTPQVLYQLAYYNEYEKFVEMYEQNPIDLNARIPNYNNIAMINVPFDNNVFFSVKPNKFHLLLYMLQHGAKFRADTWEMLFNIDIFTDDEIVELVKAGADPFVFVPIFDGNYARPTLIFKLLQLESVRTDPRISGRLPPHIKKIIKQKVLDTARPFFDIEGMDYNVVSELIQYSFYNGVLDYDNTRNELIAMAQNIGKVRQEKGWPVGIDVYNLATMNLGDVDNFTTPTDFNEFTTPESPEFIEI